MKLLRRVEVEQYPRVIHLKIDDARGIIVYHYASALILRGA